MGRLRVIVSLAGLWLGVLAATVSSAARSFGTNGRYRLAYYVGGRAVEPGAGRAGGCPIAAVGTGSAVHGGDEPADTRGRMAAEPFGRSKTHRAADIRPHETRGRAAEAIAGRVEDRWQSLRGQRRGGEAFLDDRPLRGSRRGRRSRGGDSRQFPGGGHARAAVAMRTRPARRDRGGPEGIFL